MKQHRVKLSEADRAWLERFTRQGSAKAQELTRARVLLSADEDGAALKDEQISVALGVTVQTIERIRKHYCQEGLERAVHRQPRPDKGIPRKVDGEAEGHLIALACSDAPGDAPRWTLKMLADELVRLELVESISIEQVRKTLKKTRSSHT
jgi:transposase